MTHFLKRVVSLSVVVCLYDQNDEVDKVFLKRSCLHKALPLGRCMQRLAGLKDRLILVEPVFCQNRTGAQHPWIDPGAYAKEGRMVSVV